MDILLIMILLLYTLFALPVNWWLPLIASTSMYPIHLHLIQRDVWGPATNTSSNGYKHHAHSVDVYSLFLGFFSYAINLMPFRHLFASKHMWNILLIKDLNAYVLIGVVSFFF